MNRIDIAKLRKSAGLSQRELAEKLQVRPSFLSAIENGRSRLPEEKLEMLKNIFDLESFEDYYYDEKSETHQVVPPHTHPMDATDTISSLLNHFHDMAHRNHSSSHESELGERVEYLTKRNDRLSDRLDELRVRVDELQAENFRLKELLLKHGIEY